MPKRPGSATVQVGLRLKENLRKRLAAEAERAGRSLNLEIVNRLERSLEFEMHLAAAQEHADSAKVLLSELREMQLQSKELYARLFDRLMEEDIKRGK